MVKKNNWRTFFGNSIYENLPVDRIQTVDLIHYRKRNGNMLLAKGGRTIVNLIIDNMEFTGTARCMDIDNYCKAEGRRIAMKNACLKYWANEAKMRMLHLSSIGQNF